MYKIYLDGNLLFHKNIKELKVYNPIVELIQNGISTFEFDIDNSNPCFMLLQVHKSIIEVRKEDKILFYGRVVEIEDNKYNIHHVFCESALAFLCDSIIDAYEWKGNVVGLLEKFITEHNAQVEQSKRFNLGYVTVKDPNDYIVRSNSNYDSTWANVKSKLLDKLGGYIQLRIENGIKYIDYLVDLKTPTTKKIQFAKNIIDVKKTKAYTDIATLVKPLGKKDESGKRLTIRTVNNNYDVLENPDAVKLYGKIIKTVIFDDVTEPSNLLRKGQDYLSEASKMTYSISINAVNLGLFDISIDTKIGVLSEYHKIDDYFIPQKIKIHLLNASQNKIDLNSVSKSLTDINNELHVNSNSILDIVENVKNDYEVNVPKQITELKKELNSKIEQTSSDIKISVSDKLSYVTNDIEQLKKKVYVVSFTSQWGISDSKDIPPNTWSDQRPTPQENQYLWMREKYLYSDNTYKYDGERMISAQNGLDGKGIADIRSKYALSASSVQVPTSGWQDTIPTKPRDKFLWRKEIIYYSDNTNIELTPICITGDKGEKGDDAIVIHILSSNGTSFKNSSLATTLTVTIITGNTIISSAREMHERFGSAARLIWKQKLFGQTSFTLIDPTDSRLSDEGFIMTLTTNDVHTQAVFNCDLDF